MDVKCNLAVSITHHESMPVSLILSIQLIRLASVTSLHSVNSTTSENIRVIGQQSASAAFFSSFLRMSIVVRAHLGGLIASNKLLRPTPTGFRLTLTTWDALQHPSQAQLAEHIAGGSVNALSCIRVALFVSCREYLTWACQCGFALPSSRFLPCDCM